VRPSCLYWFSSSAPICVILPRSVCGEDDATALAAAALDIVEKQTPDFLFLFLLSGDRKPNDFQRAQCAPFTESRNIPSSQRSEAELPPRQIGGV